MNSTWHDLWNMVGGDEGVVIIPSERVDMVTVRWPDGSEANLYLRNNKWEFGRPIDTAPCDVAARDTY